MCRSLIALMAMAFGLVFTAVPCFAASLGYCENYANQAVSQYHRYKSIPYCFHGADWRWNANWSRQYNWCLSVPINQAHFEASHRSLTLRQCNFLAFGHY